MDPLTHRFNKRFGDVRRDKMTSYNDAAGLAGLAAKTFQASQGEDWKLNTGGFRFVMGVPR